MIFNQKDLLVFLYKLVDRYVLTQGNRYEYNHDYLNPLAITDVPKIQLIGFPRFPKDELPIREWLLLLLKAISVTNINGISQATSSSVSFSIDGSDSDRSFLSDKLDSLETIEKEIGGTKNPEDIDTIAFQLVSTLKEVNEHLSIDEQLNNYRQLDDAEDQNTDTLFSLEARFKQVDDQVAKFLTENPGDISFDLDSSEQITTETLKDIIRYNAKLLEVSELASLEVSEDSTIVDFGSVSGSTSSPNLEDYARLFRVITKPEISTKFQDDLVFAYMQVAGPNPVMLKQIQVADPRLPITLKGIEQQIRERNQNSDRLLAYEYLLPSKIPQSINI